MGFVLKDKNISIKEKRFGFISISTNLHKFKLSLSLTSVSTLITVIEDEAVEIKTMLNSVRRFDDDDDEA